MEKGFPKNWDGKKLGWQFHEGVETGDFPTWPNIFAEPDFWGKHPDNQSPMRMIQTSSPGGIDLWRSSLDKIMVGNIQGLTVVVPAATLETLADLEPGWQTGTKKYSFYKGKQPRGNWEKMESIFGKGFDLLFFLHIFCYFRKKNNCTGLIWVVPPDRIPVAGRFASWHPFLRVDHLSGTVTTLAAAPRLLEVGWKHLAVLKLPQWPQWWYWWEGGPTQNIQLTEEILHHLIGSWSHYLQGFIHPRWLFGISSMNSST